MRHGLSPERLLRHLCLMAVWLSAWIDDRLNTHRDQRLVDITEPVRAIVARSGIRDGLVQVDAQGATAAIMSQ